MAINSTTWKTRLPRWLRFQFSLLSAFAFVTVLSILLARYCTGRRHTAAVERLRAQGFEVFRCVDMIPEKRLLYWDRNKGGPQGLWMTVYRLNRGGTHEEQLKFIQGGDGFLAIDSLVICEPYSLIDRQLRMDADENDPFGDRSFWDHQLNQAELRPIRDLQNLRFASITTDFDTADVVDVIANCENLEVLHLDTPRLKPTELKRLLKLPRLRSLILRSLHIEGQDWITDFPSSASLKSLTLNCCELSADAHQRLERDVKGLLLVGCELVDD